MGVLSWIVLGFVAGLLAEKATGRRSSGCLTRIATDPLLNVTAGGGSSVSTFLVEER